MPDLKTTYMGLALSNPLLAASSTNTGTVDKVKALAAAGVGGVVLRSIFEEQIRAEVGDMVAALETQDNPEAYDYIRADYPMQIGPEKYLDIIRESKAQVTIPVIASLNCTTRDHWISYARKIEQAGADALELNVYDIPQNPDEDAAQVEARHLNLVDGVASEIGIPVAVKLGPNYTSLVNFAKRLTALNVKALVLFNRFFQPEIDIESLTLKSGLNLSSAQDSGLPVRWIALLKAHVGCDMAMTTGVHDAEGAIKGLLAGANAIQICSVLYNTPDLSVIQTMKDGICDWMTRHDMADVSAFVGRLSEPVDGPSHGFARSQYVKELLSRRE
jgi:dihydroorotate dehydrogenase (fumarate)